MKLLTEIMLKFVICIDRNIDIEWMHTIDTFLLTIDDVFHDDSQVQFLDSFYRRYTFYLLA